MFDACEVEEISSAATWRARRRAKLIRLPCVASEKGVLAFFIVCVIGTHCVGSNWPVSQ